MYSSYLYPKNPSTAIKSEFGYDDFHLSSILDAYGISMQGVDMLFARNRKPEIITSSDISDIKSSCCQVAVVFIVLPSGERKQMAFAPLFRHLPTLDRSDTSIYSRIDPQVKYTDLIVRYYHDNQSILRPVWVSAVSDNGEMHAPSGPAFNSAPSLLYGDLIQDYVDEDGWLFISNTDLDVDKDFIVVL